MSHERVTLRWALEWHIQNRLDGKQRSIMWHDLKPLLFMTRKEARAWAKQNYGYIKERLDLQTEPHGWRMPQAVRVEVIIRKVKP